MDNQSLHDFVRNDRIDELDERLGPDESMFRLQGLFETAVDCQNRRALSVLDDALVANPDASNPQFHAEALKALIERLLVEWPQGLSVFYDRTAFARVLQGDLTRVLSEHDCVNYLTKIIATIDDPDCLKSLTSAAYLDDLSVLPEPLLQVIDREKSLQTLLVRRAKNGHFEDVRRILDHHDPDKDQQYAALESTMKDGTTEALDRLLERWGRDPAYVLDDEHMEHYAQFDVPRLLRLIEHYDRTITDEDIAGQAIKSEPDRQQLRTLLDHTDPTVFGTEAFASNYGDIGAYLSDEAAALFLSENETFVPLLNEISGRTFGLYLRHRFGQLDDPAKDVQTWHSAADEPDLSVLPAYLTDRQRLRLVCRAIDKLDAYRGMVPEHKKGLNSLRLITTDWIHPDRPACFVPDELSGEGLTEADVVGNYAVVQEECFVIKEAFELADCHEKQPTLSAEHIRHKHLKDLDWDVYEFISQPANNFVNVAVSFGKPALRSLYRSRYTADKYRESLREFLGEGYDLIDDEYRGVALRSLGGGTDRPLLQRAAQQVEFNQRDGALILNGLIDRARNSEIDVAARLSWLMEQGLSVDGAFNGGEDDPVALNPLLQVMKRDESDYPMIGVIQLLDDLDDNWPVEAAAQRALDSENDRAARALLRVMDGGLFERSEILRARLPRTLDEHLSRNDAVDLGDCAQTITDRLIETATFANRSMDCYDVLIKRGLSMQDGVVRVIKRLIDLQKQKNAVYALDERADQGLNRTVKPVDVIGSIIESVGRYGRRFAPDAELIEQLDDLGDTSVDQLLQPLSRRQKKALQHLDAPVQFSDL